MKNSEPSTVELLEELKRLSRKINDTSDEIENLSMQIFDEEDLDDLDNLQTELEHYRDEYVIIRDKLIELKTEKEKHVD